MSRKQKVIALLLIAAIAGCVFAPWFWSWHSARADFRLQQQRYQKVVDEVKARSASTGEHEGQVVVGGILAYYERSATDQYTIALVTADRGHFGMAGYLYVDGAPVRITGDPYTNVEAPGDLWMCGDQVAPHWWMISCNLH